jgi:hypothetical protein
MWSFANRGCQVGGRVAWIDIYNSNLTSCSIPLPCRALFLKFTPVTLTHLDCEDAALVVSIPGTRIQIRRSLTTLSQSITTGSYWRV